MRHAREPRGGRFNEFGRAAEQLRHKHGKQSKASKNILNMNAVALVGTRPSPLNAGLFSSAELPSSSKQHPSQRASSSSVADVPSRSIFASREPAKGISPPLHRVVFNGRVKILSDDDVYGLVDQA